MDYGVLPFHHGSPLRICQLFQVNRARNPPFSAPPFLLIPENPFFLRDLPNFLSPDPSSREIAWYLLRGYAKKNSRFYVQCAGNIFAFRDFF